MINDMMMSSSSSLIVDWLVRKSVILSVHKQDLILMLLWCLNVFSATKKRSLIVVEVASKNDLLDLFLIPPAIFGLLPILFVVFGVFAPKFDG